MLLVLVDRYHPQMRRDRPNVLFSAASLRVFVSVYMSVCLSVVL